MNLNKNSLKLFNLYTIHDCFASDYKNMDLLELLIRQSFIELYFDNNYLDFVHEYFLNKIEEKTQIYQEEIQPVEKNKKVQGEQVKIESNSDEHPRLFIKIFVKSTSTKKVTSTSTDTYKKIYLPKLPEYNWEQNKEIFIKKILKN